MGSLRLLLGFGNVCLLPFLNWPWALKVRAFEFAAIFMRSTSRYWFLGDGRGNGTLSRKSPWLMGDPYRPYFTVFLMDFESLPGWLRSIVNFRKNVALDFLPQRRLCKALKRNCRYEPRAFACFPTQLLVVLQILNARACKRFFMIAKPRALSFWLCRAWMVRCENAGKSDAHLHNYYIPVVSVFVQNTNFWPKKKTCCNFTEFP